MVSLAEQVGGTEASRVTGRHVLELRRLLEQHCSQVYCPNVAEFALILRTDGDVQTFGFEGCKNVRRSRRERYITVDLGVPEHRWKSVSASEFRSYLWELTETGILCCVDRLRRDKEQIDFESLRADLGTARDIFLAGKHD